MKTIRRVSKDREKKAAKEIGGKAHAGSGAFWSKKSDFSNTNFQIEEKFTYDDIYSVKLSKLKKIEKEAKEVNKIPAFRFGFIKEKEYNYVILRRQDCVFDSEKVSIDLSSCKKSVTMKVNILKNLYINTPYSIMMSIYISGEEYLLVEWDTFVDLHNKIEKGEPI